ncbi:MAG: mannitol-1-phosphate 5-dehydrogenase [Treponema sp.]|jgi:mannitol-1-phosphate 5-dehydrogenase|nr:mannitol-1-phosphate 5-dehydrogenase [Treponema sp.]
MTKARIVIIGAGNIGRSFIGQIFSRAGWEVVFADVNPVIVRRLNESGFYTVVIKEENRPDEERRVGPVRAIDGRDTGALCAAIAGADLIAVSVGAAALPAVLPVIAAALAERYRQTPRRPLDIIIAENIRGAAEIFKSGLLESLGALSASPDADGASALIADFDRFTGLVATSIGKMVPLMRAGDLAADPLRLFAEKYETLIVDRRGFRGPLPAIPEIDAVDPVAAYVDRKLFIHNLGHAAAAYLGYRAASGLKGIAEVLALGAVEEGTRAAMNEAADALALEYRDSFSRRDLAEYIDDLIARFKNAALGDTVFRVGRDLSRKLADGDRIAGAMKLCAKHGIPCPAIDRVYRAALGFYAADENGKPFPGDARFHREHRTKDLPT